MVFDQAGLGLLAAVFAGLAAALASQHPLAPFALSLGCAGVALASVWRPGAWLFWLPALLPLLNFSPWTGWWLLDESDLLILAVLSGGYARWAIDFGLPGRRRLWPGWSGPGGLGCLCLALAATGVWSVWRGWDSGWVDWGGLSVPGRTDMPWLLHGLRDALQQGLYAGYDSAWNALRVGKSLLWALLLLPLVQHARARNRPGAATALARGMVAGLALVCLVVLWERHHYAGVFDFSQSYRTSAWFWEMHVGGGALDAYLALAAPFAVWAVWTARTPWRWAAANGVLWLTVYVVLTTFSRGVYLALLISTAFMLLSAWRLKLPPVAGAVWHRRAVVAVLLALVVPSAAVLGGGALMADRLARANTDLVGRLAHWQAGVDLLKTPADWALGLGTGHLPARYSREAPDGAYPGQAVWASDPQGRGHVQLLGPLGRGELASHFSLTQRISSQESGRYRFRVALQANKPGRLDLRLCQRHLLYDGDCQWGSLAWVAEQAGVFWLEGELKGPALLSSGRGWGSPGAVLAMSPTESGQKVNLHGVELFDADGRQVLRNTDFSEQLQHWMPAAQGHFLPWHIDNLYLEVLIERGLVGFAVLSLVVLWAVRPIWLGLKGRHTTAWVLAGSLLGLWALGMVISVMEVPRVALMLWLVLWETLHLRGEVGKTRPCNRL